MPPLSVYTIWALFILQYNYCKNYNKVYKKIFSEKYKHKINLILETKIDYPRQIISDDYLQKFNFRRIYDNSEIPIIELCNERDFDNKTDFLFNIYD